MESNDILIYSQRSIETIVDIIKVFSLIMFIYYTDFKLVNKRIIIKLKDIVLITLIALVYVSIKKEVNYMIGVISLTIAISLVFSKNDIENTILVTIISFSVNQVLSILSISMCFIMNRILNIENDYFYLITITVLHIMMLYYIFKFKRFKYGITFLQNQNKNECISVLILNISIMILISIIIVVNFNVAIALDATLALIISIFIMFITIQKSLQLYYKQKLLIKELQETKEELANKEKEIEKLEAENLKISKNNHTIAHKQKSLEYKLKEIINKTEISNEEVGELTDRIDKIRKDIYKEKEMVELSKTGISQIDDMLEYMQSECNKNKIEFELQIKGNIYYMTNNLISISELETLLADHIKNAIIAINHTNNINKSILVRLGEIDGIYSLYIYDSGAEFEKQTLENLGKIPSTTHADEGGTGMGFMNTFDTLKRCKASLIIEEYNEPSKDNYTKVLMIKFDNRSEFKVKSYR